MLGWGTCGDICQDCAAAWATIVPAFAVFIVVMALFLGYLEDRETKQSESDADRTSA